MGSVPFPSFSLYDSSASLAVHACPRKRAAVQTNPVSGLSNPKGQPLLGPLGWQRHMYDCRGLPADVILDIGWRELHPHVSENLKVPAWLPGECELFKKWKVLYEDLCYFWEHIKRQHERNETLYCMFRRWKRSSCFSRDSFNRCKLNRSFESVHAKPHHALKVWGCEWTIWVNNDLLHDSLCCWVLWLYRVLASLLPAGQWNSSLQSFTRWYCIFIAVPDLFLCIVTHIQVIGYRLSKKKQFRARTWFYAPIVDWILRCDRFSQKWRRMNMSLNWWSWLEKSCIHHHRDVCHFLLEGPVMIF